MDAIFSTFRFNFPLPNFSIFYKNIQFRFIYHCFLLPSPTRAPHKVKIASMIESGGGLKPEVDSINFQTMITTKTRFEMSVVMSGEVIFLSVFFLQSETFWIFRY